ncbi:hypothetical protein ZOSMA_64G00380 [Zostera marina]|uniref:Uncharacterized protein n=1 Tax=Zostera marina TaxID=29655 RepID=A0A0K9NUT9_ZOSMR|nr:hypothetical protein ZOSMA_64G00380 [Zostera marina]
MRNLSSWTSHSSLALYSRSGRPSTAFFPVAETAEYSYLVGRAHQVPVSYRSYSFPIC